MDEADDLAFELQDLGAAASNDPDWTLVGKEYLSSRQARRRDKRNQKLERLAQEADEMKFSHSIQFNAVPDWSSHYIAYSNLKKLSVNSRSTPWLR